MFNKKNKARIVFLDEQTLDLGDISLNPLKACGDYRGFKLNNLVKLTPAVLNAEIIICNKYPLKEAQLAQLPKLKLVCVAATGTNHVDLAAHKNRGIAVCNVAGYSTDSVVEHTWQFILALAHRLLEHHQAALNGTWQKSGEFALLKFPYQEIAGKKIGILGYGHIGRRIAKIARLFGMKVLIAKLPRRNYLAHPTRFPLKTVLANSDFICLHTALTNSTKEIINQKTLGLMKKSAYLINLGRGLLVNESDLASALKLEKIAGYATDVTTKEPPPKNCPLLKKGVREKILFSPHIAWASRESRQRLINEIALNILAFQNNKKRNRIV